MGRAAPSGEPGCAPRVPAPPLCSRRRHPEGARLPALVAEAARLEDAPALAAMENTFVGSGWSASAFEREIRSGLVRLVVLRAPRPTAESRAIAGYCGFRVVADEMELLTLAVTPEWRRRGLGRWLVRLALAVAGRHGARAAFLEVRSGNGSARQLYASLGFEETGRRAGYYHDPEDDAIVLFRPCGPGSLNS